MKKALIWVVSSHKRSDGQKQSARLCGRQTPPCLPHCHLLDLMLTSLFMRWLIEIRQRMKGFGGVQIEWLEVVRVPVIVRVALAAQYPIVSVV